MDVPHMLLLTLLSLHMQVVVFRGLRLKCGLDCGRLQGEINGITGRMSYRLDPCIAPATTRAKLTACA